MIQTVFLVYDDYNSKLYDHADYIAQLQRMAADARHCAMK